MMEITNQLSEELDITYWQLMSKSVKETIQLTINREEKELLRKILLAKGIALTDNIFEVQDNGVVVVSVNNSVLVFDDVKAKDTVNVTHLAKISDMLNSAEHKKLTWYKLKNLEL